MATNKLKALKSLVRALEKEEKTERQYDPAKQVEGYKERIEGSGIDVEKATDTRNPLEKALNLRENQNALFDIFEVINRPQQALFGAVNAAQKDENILEGAKQGIAGEKETPFGEILREGGMDDTPIFGEVGWDDIVGFAGDVLLDPIDIPLFGASKMVKIGGKAVKYADAVADSMKAADVARDAMKATDVALEAAQIANKSDAVVTLTKEAAKNKEAWGVLAKKYDAIRTMKRSRRTTLQVATAYSGTGFKNMFRFADNNFTKLLEKLDTKSLQLGVEKMSKAGLGKAAKELGAVKHYKDFKQGIVKIFDWTRELKNKGVDLIGQSRRVRGAQKQAETVLEVSMKAWTEDTGKYKALFIESAKKNGMYDKLVDSALNGRSLDDLGSKVYPHIKGANKSTRVLEAAISDHIDELMMPIMEHGGAMFKIVDGQVIADVKGLSQTTTIYDMFNDQSLMFRMGLTDEMKDTVEEWTKEYAPKWYESHITENTPMFVAAEETGNIKRTWRFNEGFESSGEVGQKLRELKSELTKMKEISDASIDNLTETLVGYDKVVKELEDVESIMSSNAARVAAGETLSEADELYVVPTAGSKTYAKAKAFETHINERTVRLADMQQEMSSLTGRGSRAKIKKLAEDADKVSKEIDGFKGLLDKAKLDGVKDGSVKKLADYKSELTGRAQAFTSSVVSPLSSLKTGAQVKTIPAYQRIVEGATKMSDEMTIPVYLNEKAIEHIAQFANLDGVAQYLSATHHFMNDSVDIVNTLLKTRMEFQEGYMSHIMNDSWGKVNFPQFDTVGKRNPFLGSEYIGNTKKLASRKYQTSALAANDLVKQYADWLISSGSVADSAKEVLESTKNIEMFSKSVRTSLADFIKKAPTSAGDAQLLRTVMKETLVGQLKGAELIIPANSLTSPNAPRGFVKTTKQAVVSKLEGMSNLIDPEDNKEVIGAIKQWLDTASDQSDIFYIDKNINRLVGKLTDKEETGIFLKTLEFVNNVFKKNKLLSPGFQMRNVAGNMSNMYLAGMPVNDIMDYSKRALDVMKTGDSTFAKATTMGLDKLTPREIQLLETYNEFALNGFQQVGNRIQDIPDYVRDASKKVRGDYNPLKIYDKVIEFNFKMNERQDSIYRMAAFMWAKDNAGKVMEMGFEEPAQFVRHALFDFADLSAVEQDVFKKIIPFYTFTKKNLGFQMRNMMINPNRYNRLAKSFDSMWGMLDLSPEELDAYSVENFWIPIPFKDKDGKYHAIKASLPLGDIGEWVSDPFRRLMASSTPVARAPFEIATNTQAFSGMPIQEFKGQKGFQIPELNRGVEYALNQAGLDVPATLGFDIGRTAGQVFKGEINNPMDALSSGIGRTLTSEKDPAATLQRKAYEELDQLEGLMRYYKQEGIEILSLAEITNKDNKNRTTALLNNLKSLIKRG